MPVRCEHCETTPGGNALAVGSYLGRVTRSARTSSCDLSLVAHDDAWALPDHGHDWPFISMLLTGSYVSRTRTREHEFKRGSAVFHPRSFQHRDEIGRDGGQFLCVQLDPEMLSDAGGLRYGRDVVSLDADQAYIVLGELYCALVTGADHISLDALSAELTAALFTDDRSCTSQKPGWLRHVEERLHDETHVSLSELSSDAGVHSTTLTRQFRRHRHCSIGEFRNRARAKRAFLAVLAGVEPLAEISLAAGYADQSHMSRDFKLNFGHPPAKIRRLARGI